MNIKNHTNRIRKMRREGRQALTKELGRPSGERFNRSGTAPSKVGGAHRANARKKTLTTTRKTKRQRPASGRGRTAPKTRQR